MPGLGNVLNTEPTDLIEFVRLAITCLRPIYQHLEVEGNPMGRRALILAMHVAIAHKFYRERMGQVLLFNFFNYGILRRVVEFERSPAAVPAAVLIAASYSALIEQIIPLPVMANVDHRDADVIYPRFHNLNMTHHAAGVFLGVALVILLSAPELLRRLDGSGDGLRVELGRKLCLHFF
jgi:hypothetical protein